MYYSTLTNLPTGYPVTLVFRQARKELFFDDLHMTTKHDVENTVVANVEVKK